jgi:hypothetical protein
MKRLTLVRRAAHRAAGEAIQWAGRHAGATVHRRSGVPKGSSITIASAGRQLVAVQHALRCAVEVAALALCLDPGHFSVRELRQKPGSERLDLNPGLTLAGGVMVSKGQVRGSFDTRPLHDSAETDFCAK